MHRKSRPTEVDQDQLALLKSLTRLSMFVEADVNGGQLTDMIGFLVEPFTIGFNCCSCRILVAVGIAVPMVEFDISVRSLFSFWGKSGNLDSESQP